MENPKDTKVEKDSELKEWLVNYVGNKENPEDGDVTVEMIVNTVAREFPENFVRGYDQALSDIYARKENEDNGIHQKNA